MKLIRARMPFSPSVDVRIVRAVIDTDTATSRNWAATNRPVRHSAGVYIGSPHILGSLWTPANAQQGKDVLSAKNGGIFDVRKQIKQQTTTRLSRLTSRIDSPQLHSGCFIRSEERR